MYPRLIIQAKCVELKRIYLEMDRSAAAIVIVVLMKPCLVGWCQLYIVVCGAPLLVWNSRDFPLSSSVGTEEGCVRYL